MTEISRNALQSVQRIVILFNLWSCNNTITVFDETDPSSACSNFSFAWEVSEINQGSNPKTFIMVA